MPSTCKLAHIIPIHISKSRSLPNNYWPVALTSHLIKVFEKVVHRCLVDFMNTHRLFNHSQHGFRGGWSCLSQLINHLDHITSLLEGGGEVQLTLYIWTLPWLSIKLILGQLLESSNHWTSGVNLGGGSWPFSLVGNRRWLLMAASQGCHKLRISVSLYLRTGANSKLTTTQK